MNNNELKNYIDHYTIENFNQIELVWNGQYGKNFVDENYDFRIQICEFIIPQINTVNIDLIRDLYLEVGKTSPITFSVYKNFHLFAYELLERGGKDYLLDYIRGASYSMDTLLSSGNINISPKRAKELLEYFDILKIKSVNSELLNDDIRNRLVFYCK